MFYDACSKLKIDIYGESHSESIGVKISGVPKGESINLSALSSFLNRRKSSDEFSTERKEPDNFSVLSGIENSFTTGDIIDIKIDNVDVMPSDYENVNVKPRPSTSDYPALVKGIYKSGSGAFSGRMTAPLCLAGGIIIQILERKNIVIKSHILSVGNLNGKKANPLTGFIENDEKFIKKCKNLAKKTKDKGDSLGGVIECVVLNTPIGTGNALFCGLESKISDCIFAIPSVKGIEFGSGFSGSKHFGSVNNDPITYINSEVKMLSNNDGGISGGMANGMPIIFSVAFKPVPSISIPQKTVDLDKKIPCSISVTGRHDSCILFRATPIVESATAIAVYSALLLKNENNLPSLREKIDNIDNEIASLLEDRLKVVNKIKEVKKENKLNTVDLKREKEVLDKLSFNHPAVKDLTNKIYKDIFDFYTDKQKDE